MFLSFFGIIELNAQAPDWQWAKSIGGDPLNTGVVNAVCIAVNTANKDVYTMGAFNGTIDFDPGPGISNVTSTGAFNIFISKSDSTGHFIWAKGIGSNTGYIYGLNMALDNSGNVFVTGYYQGTIDFDPGAGILNLSAEGYREAYVIKLAGSGNLVWAKTLAPSDGYISIGYALAFDHLNNLVITGGFYGQVDFDPGTGIHDVWSIGEGDIFILKLDNNGNFEWVKDIGGSLSSGWGNSIALDTISGDIFITGTFSGPTDFDPGPGYYNIGSIDQEYNIFISKYNPQGDLIWAKEIDGESVWTFTLGLSIAVNSFSGDVYTIGQFYGTCDFDPGIEVYNITSNGDADIFISKLDSTGNFIWAHGIGGTGTDIGNTISLNKAGGEDIFITGSFTGTYDFDPGLGTTIINTAGDNDIFISKFNSTGDFIWVKQIGGTGSEINAALALDLSGHVYLTGSYTSENLDFDTIGLTNTEGYNAFYSRLDHCTGIVTNSGDHGLGSLRDVISCSEDGAIISFSLLPMTQINLTSGEIVITKNLTLSGQGMTDLTISGNNTARIFHVLPGKNLILKNLSLQNTNSFVNGGAIYNEGNLTLENVLFQNNFEKGLPKGLTCSPEAFMIMLGNVNFKL